MSIVCGVDEAGRGPLAGPVCAAAVILDPQHRIEGLADSKTLGARRREALVAEIHRRAIAWAVAWASVEEIDALNILQASLLAMRRAVEGLAVAPERVLVDGLHRPPLTLPVQAIVRGDATVASIAAASILAKVARDAEMLALHDRHPQYGFDRHKGYPTRAHLEALRRHGISAAHRRSFAPVRAVLGVTIWIGGMFFAYGCLRPAAGELDPPVRLKLWAATLRRFFGWVWASVALILGSGFYMLAVIADLARVPLFVYLMLYVGVAMALIFAYVYFAPFATLGKAVAAQEWKAGAAALNSIRIAVAVNLTLGLLNIAIATAGAL